MNVDLALEKKLIKNVENANVVGSNSFQKELSSYSVNYLWSVASSSNQLHFLEIKQTMILVLSPNDKTKVWWKLTLP